jgi:hypothetical protein
MHITRLIIRSFSILDRTVVNTDDLDPEYLQFACETLANARASLAPLLISDDGQSPIYLGLGWPEGIPNIRVDPSSQQLVGQLFAELPEPTGTLFYLHHEGGGPVYAVLPAEQPDLSEEELEEYEQSEAVVEELLENLESAQGGNLHEKLARFDRMWDAALDSLPVVLQFGPSDWGENWDSYAMYIATAILLED